MKCCQELLFLLFLLFLLSSKEYTCEAMNSTAPIPNLLSRAGKTCNCTDMNYTDSFIYREDWIYYRLSPEAIGQVSASSVVFDIGGNIGRDTKFFRDAGATVYVFEPIPELNEALTKRYQGDDKVHVFPFAVGSWQRMTKIYIGGESKEAASMENRDIGSPIVNVTEIRVENIIHVLHALDVPTIDVMNINCEGCEYEVLQALLMHPHILHRIQYLNFAYHFQPISYGICGILDGLQQHSFQNKYCTRAWQGWRNIGSGGIFSNLGLGVR